MPDPTNKTESLAEFLHEKFCSWNHTDGCSWFYETEWTEYAHVKWVNNAIAVRQWMDRPTKLPDENDSLCACSGCPNKATETENSPHMNDYCDPCTYERHDTAIVNGDPHR